MTEPKSLLAKGWTRQCVASEPRLSEAVEMYESLGLEVLLVPVLRECAADGACTACFSADENPDRYKAIYTHPKESSQGRNDELFDS